MSALHDSAGEDRRSHRQPLRAEPRYDAFTLLELAVVLAILTLGVLMLLPALAHTQPQSRTVQCLSNLKQMAAGWQMYASDNHDFMMPNAPLGGVTGVSGVTDPDVLTWCGGGAEDWGSNPNNIDPTRYQKSIMASYVGHQLGVYKCPADTIPSANGQRIRTYSMQSMMGNLYPSVRSSAMSDCPGYTAYVKVSDLTGAIGPSAGLVFLEENMCNLNDGWLEVNLPGVVWTDVPGSYHNGAMGVSFADGHTELHPWVTPSLLIPVRLGYGHPSGGNIPPKGPPGPNNPDWVWWQAHTTAPVP